MSTEDNILKVRDVLEKFYSTTRTTSSWNNHVIASEIVKELPELKLMDEMNSLKPKRIVRKGSWLLNIDGEETIVSNDTLKLRKQAAKYLAMADFVEKEQELKKTALENKKEAYRRERQDVWARMVTAEVAGRGSTYQELVSPSTRVAVNELVKIDMQKKFGSA
jgi:hypothetical protein